MKKNSSNSDEMLSLVKRALDHFENKTTDQADQVMSNPVEAYVDPKRYENEINRISVSYTHLTLPTIYSV